MDASPTRTFSAEAGFTLVEAIVATVIAVIAVGGVGVSLSGLVERWSTDMPWLVALWR
jgi:type II secretory pathway pseudopilin PulG